MTTSRKEYLRQLALASGKNLDRLSSPSLIMALLTVVALGILLLTAWGCQDRLPVENTPVTTALKTPTPEVANQSYVNKLYYFSIGRDQLAQSFQVEERASDCRGTVFSNIANDQEDVQWSRAQYRICYLNTVSAVDAEALLKQLDQRKEVILSGLHSGADVGLPKACTVGKEKLACLERYIQGRDSLSQKEMRWYQAVVGYEGRLYAIEAMCDSAAWDQLWPSLLTVMNSLRFDSGVIPETAP